MAARHPPTPSRVSRRPGPLQELPLELFLPAHSLATPSAANPFKSPVRPGKRPPSPGTPSLFSPAKRRILAQEGVLSPDKTFKSPFAAPSASASAAGGRFAPAHFDALLRGPDSPARKLDFGAPRLHTGAASVPAPDFSTPLDATPKRRTSPSGSPPLAPSPELSPRTRAAVRAAQASQSQASSSSASTSSAASRSTSPTAIASQSQSQTQGNHDPMPFPKWLEETTDIFVVPRALPPLETDTQSPHYPGFTVFRDTFSIAPSADDVAAESDAMDVSEDERRDGAKENVAVRRRARKAATAAGDMPALKTLLSPGVDVSRERARTAPGTPRGRGELLFGTFGMVTDAPANGHGKQVPQVQLQAGVDDNGGWEGKETLSLEWTPRVRREARRMLEEEVDEYDG